MPATGPLSLVTAPVESSRRSSRSRRATAMEGVQLSLCSEFRPRALSPGLHGAVRPFFSARADATSLRSTTNSWPTASRQKARARPALLARLRAQCELDRPTTRRAGRVTDRVAGTARTGGSRRSASESRRTRRVTARQADRLDARVHAYLAARAVAAAGAVVPERPSSAAALGARLRRDGGAAAASSIAGCYGRRTTRARGRGPRRRAIAQRRRAARRVCRRRRRRATRRRARRRGARRRAVARAAASLATMALRDARGVRRCAGSPDFGRARRAGPASRAREARSSGRRRGRASRPRPGRRRLCAASARPENQAAG